LGHDGNFKTFGDIAGLVSGSNDGLDCSLKHHRIILSYPVGALTFAPGCLD
jgi:hypothetical protein